MSWLPTSQQTFVSELTKHDVLVKMHNYTQEVNSEFITEKPLFNGKVGSDGFRVSSVIQTPQNSLPLIVGKVESTNLGSIIFLKLKLFPAAILYLKVASLLSLLLSLTFLLLSKWYLAGLISLLLGVLNYVILSLSFQRKCQVCIQSLKNLLEGDHKN
ncbi:MAG: hypothetical protein CMB80_33470 [Flammeovirgaceae bacterium]|nr:hypothetical protein [Flammeovirgaceae bacterium]MBR07590.1 hypothetical protein [Rickettsiales bacterium]HCX25183.1 hypothetical protein [Cytophagales bacterium]|tara:strand:- start:3472 stop:3945 length:474 start_codon:yes stop_codon:yes gene_type:complete